MNLNVILFGYITRAQFGFLSAILNKDLEQLISKVLIALIRKDISLYVRYVTLLKLEPLLNVHKKIAQVIIILNVQERQVFICNKGMFKA
jgi:hypothetical protein